MRAAGLGLIQMWPLLLTGDLLAVPPMLNWQAPAKIHPLHLMMVVAAAPPLVAYLDLLFEAAPALALAHGSASAVDFEETQD